MSKRTLATIVAGLAAMPTILLLAATPAAAAGDGSVQVSNTETVQAYLDATGKVDVARVYEQVAMKGRGTVDLRNPVEAQGLRNLDGFGGFEVKDGVMVGRFDVDGEQRASDRQRLHEEAAARGAGRLPARRPARRAR